MISTQLEMVFKQLKMADKCLEMVFKQLEMISTQLGMVFKQLKMADKCLEMVFKQLKVPHKRLLALTSRHFLLTLGTCPRKTFRLQSPEHLTSIVPTCRSFPVGCCR
jgi:hypothetical protein